MFLGRSYQHALQSHSREKGADWQSGRKQSISECQLPFRCIENERADDATYDISASILELYNEQVHHTVSLSHAVNSGGRSTSFNQLHKEKHQSRLHIAY